MWIKKAISLIIVFIFAFTEVSVDLQYLSSLFGFSKPVGQFNLLSVAYADTATPYCSPADNGQVGVFSSGSGYCELDPLDTSGKCPSPYIFSTEYKKCVTMPLCPGLYIWNSQTKQCESVTATPVGGTEPTFPENSCAVDANGDGEIQQNEIHQCQQTPQGYICPTGQTQCNPQYQQPSCPAQYTYNANTQKCEYTPTVGVCSSQQVQITQYQCPVNGQIYSDLNQCNSACLQTAQCSASYGDITWSPPRGPCGNPISTYDDFRHGPQVVCDYLWPGSVAVSASCYPSECSHRCDIRHNGRWYCNTLCPDEGWCYHCGIASITCRGFVGYTCPLGNYPCTGNPPTCQKGQACVTYNQTVTKWQCSLTGTQYDTQEQCTTSCYSGCPPGGTFNPSTGKCEATATCQTGTLQPEGCFTGYGCPLGNYQCQNLNGTWMCSPHQCITSSQLQDEGDVIPFGYEDDGQRDAQGNCLETIYIFNGKGMRCKKSGVQTGFHNCCNESQGKIYDSTGSTGKGVGYLMDIGKTIYGIYRALSIGNMASNIASKGGQVIFNTSEGTAKVFYTGSGKIMNLSYKEGSSLADSLLKAGVPGKIEQGPNGASVIFQSGGNADAATGLAMGDFIKNSGITSSVVSLATSLAISDPVLSASVNLVAQAYLWYIGWGNPIGFAAAVVQLGMYLFMQRCDQQDIITSTFNDSKYCHEVGEYCIKKWPLVGCVQKAKSFCCFNSKLARIIHEQGRPQLVGFGVNSWGSPKTPNCRGFLPEEFQALDFNRIDLSEYIEDIQKNIRQNLAPQLQQQIQQNWGR
ncbi:conjugal transfer protein TraN [Thermodesulfovibrio sp. 1176]|uniref:conjugal transfer protein TraN n=1 Tax=Thermodesulfovibrio sp. 1176 TaxID=3043424 RepID=UPI0024826413|nr:conjugal transfer protein TraN [Thermodesulfovibrio sp. 1176]MDI1473043.1 conjugal transfer protein TraN [Thermodesulfovibrio sp. 1176]